jgi:hypothetical protein
MHLETPQSGGENIGCTWEQLGGPATSLQAPATSLGAPATHLGAPAINLGALRITVEQSRKNSSFGNAAGAPLNHGYYLSCNDC